MPQRRFATMKTCVRRTRATQTLVVNSSLCLGGLLATTAICVRAARSVKTVHAANPHLTVMTKTHVRRTSVILPMGAAIQLIPMHATTETNARQMAHVKMGPVIRAKPSLVMTAIYAPSMHVTN